MDIGVLLLRLAVGPNALRARIAESVWLVRWTGLEQHGAIL